MEAVQIVRRSSSSYGSLIYQDAMVLHDEPDDAEITAAADDLVPEVNRAREAETEDIPVCPRSPVPRSSLSWSLSFRRR